MVIISDNIYYTMTDIKLYSLNRGLVHQLQWEQLILITIYFQADFQIRQQKKALAALLGREKGDNNPHNLLGRKAKSDDTSKALMAFNYGLDSSG